MPLGAHTETTLCVHKLQYDSCLDTKSHEKSSRTSIVLKNKFRGGAKLGESVLFKKRFSRNEDIFKGIFQKKSKNVPLGAHTETTLCVDKLQHDSCLDTKSHEESSCTSVVMKNKSKGRGELGITPRFFNFLVVNYCFLGTVFHHNQIVCLWVHILRQYLGR